MMNKETKKLIANMKITDEDLETLVKGFKPTSNEESVSSGDSEDQNNAKKESAKQKDSKNLSMAGLQKMIADGIASAMKPAKKDEPNATHEQEGFKIGEWNLVE